MILPMYSNLFFSMIYNNVNDEFKDFFLPFKNSIFSSVKNFKIHINSLDDSQKEFVIPIYIKYKNYYNILSRFVYKYKIKKAINYNCFSDLYGNNLDIYPEKQTITLFQHNTLYKFRLTDLINIFVESLLNQEGLFPSPKLPKNPYTNIKFNKVHFFNILIKLKLSNFQIPIIIMLFYNSNLSLKKMLYDNYPYIKEKVIENFPNYSPSLFLEIKEMIKTLEWKTNFIFVDIILTKKQKDEFIKDFSKPLVKWFKSRYSSNPNVRDFSKNTLIGDLKILFKKNYPCLKKRTNIINIIDASNNIILRSNNTNTIPNRRRRRRRNAITSAPINLPPPPTSSPPSPPSTYITALPNINSPVVNNYIPIRTNDTNWNINLPPLLRPLITQDDHNMLIQMLNENNNPNEIFASNDRIPRSPVNNTLNNSSSNASNSSNNTLPNITRSRRNTQIPLSRNQQTSSLFPSIRYSGSNSFFRRRRF
tara:strand:+ start:11172 stop:12602 length:1431 start_codon:yes stop_codon:yes gene_type:complete